MSKPVEHEKCRDFLRQQALAAGCDITVSTAPPLVPSPYGENCFKCPHGTTYWIEPTGEQIAEWVRDGVA